MSNSLKFTNEGGQIKIKIDVLDQQVIKEENHEKRKEKRVIT